LHDTARVALRQSPLANFFLIVYVLLVVYATLYPLSGWRDPGGSAFAFIAAPWPRYVTAFDLGANFFGYLPYGVLCLLALRPRLATGAALLLAVVTAAVLSLCLEALQSYLPARIPSNVDVIANVAGAIAGGVVGAWLAPRLLGGGRLRGIRAAILAPGVAGDLGLTLIGLWLFAQLNPATLLFASGDLRDLISGSVERHDAELYISVEAATAAANLVALALLVSAVVRPQAPIGRLAAALTGVGLVVKTVAFAIVMHAEHVFAWLTPGAQLGLGAGTVLALAALRLPPVPRLALAAMLLMAATVLVNLAPPNPYLAATLKVWEQGHFLNFNGLTRLVAAAWPFAALGYLVYLAAALRREPLR
jgi:VanZ family protein